MLKPDTQKRYKSAIELRKDLEIISEGKPFIRFPVNAKILISAIFGFLLLGGIFTGIWLLSFESPESVKKSGSPFKY